MAQIKRTLSEIVEDCNGEFIDAENPCSMLIKFNDTKDLEAFNTVLIGCFNYVPALVTFSDNGESIVEI